MNNWTRSVVHLFLRLLPRLAYPVIRGPLRGARIVLGALSGKGGGASVYLNMIEPEQTSILVNLLKDRQVFFDIGANVGYYTLLASRLVGSQGKVFAFEPVVRNIVYLYRHTELNKAKNVTIIPIACSADLSLQIFTQGDDFAMGHLATSNEARDGLLVPTVSVDEVTQRLGVAPHVMKIDVEGAELHVLKGAQDVLRTAKPVILLSTHSDSLREDCLHYLRDLSYEHKVLSSDATNPSEFLVSYSGK